MLTEPLAAVFTATLVALMLLLANVFQRPIALFFARPIPGVPDQAFNETKSGQRIPNPLGDLINKSWDERLLLAAIDQLPLPTGDGSPFPFPPLSASSADLPPSPPTTSIPSPSETSTGVTSPTSTESETPSPVPDPTDLIPHSPGIDKYHLYTGDGSIAAGWPHKADWMSFSEMFATNIPLILHSCTLYHVPPNTLPETLALHTAILTIASATTTDPRFILSIILQESNGCVRVPTSFSPSNTIRNPGLMQSHNGPATCNEDASPLSPCPASTIEEMIREGTAGTFEGKGMGLVMALRTATKDGNVDDVGRYYRAARVYNSGSVDPSGDLGRGVATHCYASDVANRLRGWSLGTHGCGEGGVGLVGVEGGLGALERQEEGMGEGGGMLGLG